MFSLGRLLLLVAVLHGGYNTGGFCRAYPIMPSFSGNGDGDDVDGMLDKIAKPKKATFEELRDLVYGNSTHLVERMLQSNRIYPGEDFPYEAPGRGQQRSPCPAINTLANHGLIDRSGMNIDVEVLAVQIGLLMDIDPVVPRVNGIAGARRSQMLTVDEQGRELLNISDLFCHNAEEHDSSFVRPDNGIAGVEGAKRVSADLAMGLLRLNPSSDKLNWRNIETYQRTRMTDSLENNPTVEYNPSGAFNIAGESTYAMLLGQTRKLTKVTKLAMLTFLVYERVPEGYVPFNVRFPSRYNPVTNPNTAQWLYDFSAGTPEGDVFGYYSGVFEELLGDIPLADRVDDCTDVP